MTVSWTYFFSAVSEFRLKKLFEERESLQDQVSCLYYKVGKHLHCRFV